ncbi:3-dehydroquinate dehydratase [Candidatus Electrothrix communis]|uniref:3-dehydroquinate dehydratase n=1 Tax=Candidatus Electrothrix communis TaxID=1859133 RepID=A0A3S3RPF7_9BACT|nr:3-dehydroquinate dehydratase [Candidatus Electrothrix communis]
MAQMTRGKICVSLAGADVAVLAAQASQVVDRADVIEVRLDSMRHPDVAACCAALDKQLLFTNRPSWEGGAFSGSEEQRIEPLLQAVQQQAAYVDCELRAESSLRRQLLEAMSGGPTRMILSWHNFETTPPQAELEEVLVQMMESGARTGKVVGKIVTTAQSRRMPCESSAFRNRLRPRIFP